jgi:hypothetical protein
MQWLVLMMMMMNSYGSTRPVPLDPEDALGLSIFVLVSPKSQHPLR